MTTLSILAWIAHGVAVLILALSGIQSPAMTLFCVIPGVLIGCASVAAVRGRPITLYGAFGALMGFVFWMGVSAVNQSEFLVLIFLALLAAGAVWLLQQPSWPSAVFTGLVVLGFVGLNTLQYRNRHLLIGVDDETIRRTFVTALSVLVVGLLYLSVGFAEVLLQPPVPGGSSGYWWRSSRMRWIDFRREVRRPTIALHLVSLIVCQEPGTARFP